MLSFNFEIEAKNYITVKYDSDKGLKLDELYKVKELKGYNINLGKKHIEFKNGDYINLLASKEGPAVPMFYYSKDHKYFTGEAALSFIGENTNRYMFIHRISNNTFIKNLQIGISESAIAHNKINPLYYIPQYYVPFYLIKKISGLDNEYNAYEDSYIGIDFKYQNNILAVYGELLVDEYPYQDFATNPDKRAHLIGFKAPLKNKYWFNIQYSNVYAGVYEHRYELNRYDYLGECIGHRYGPDTVEYSVEFGIDKKEYRYIFSFANVKKGPNNLEGTKNVGDGGVLLNNIISEINEYSIKYRLNKFQQYYEFEFKYITDIVKDIDEYKFGIRIKYNF